MIGESNILNTRPTINGMAMNRNLRCHLNARLKYRFATRPVMEPSTSDEVSFAAIETSSKILVKKARNDHDHAGGTLDLPSNSARKPASRASFCYDLRLPTGDDPRYHVADGCPARDYSFLRLHHDTRSSCPRPEPSPSRRTLARVPILPFSWPSSPCKGTCLRGPCKRPRI